MISINIPTTIRIMFISSRITYLLVEMDMMPSLMAAGIPEYAMTKDMAEAVSYTHLDVYKRQVYTNPEIGCVGISADEAKARGMEVVTKKYIMSANGKSILSQQERGFIKVVADRDSHRILGAQMMCARATDMISQFAVAIANELTLEDMAKVIFPHPTFSEGILEAVR